MVEMLKIRQSRGDYANRASKNRLRHQKFNFEGQISQAITESDELFAHYRPSRFRVFATFAQMRRSKLADGTCKFWQDVLTSG